MSEMTTAKVNMGLRPARGWFELPSVERHRETSQRHERDKEAMVQMRETLREM